MNLSFLTASRLRVILSITLGLILIAAIGIFYLAYGMLSTSATETGDQVASARDSQNTLQRLQALKKDLASKQTLIDRTAEITGSADNIAVLTRVVADLHVYAERAHLSISNWSIGGEQATVSSGTGTGAAATAGPATRSVNITLASPVGYTDYLNFLHYVEQSLPKLKISKVNLQKGDGVGTIGTEPLTVEVYVK